MALEKCPRCELNYILDGDSLCTVCKREVRGETAEPDDLPELCSECGEMPAVPGSELCLSCLKEMTRRVASATTDDTIDVIVTEDPVLEIDSVSAMDEIELDLGTDIETEAFEDEVDEFDDEEESDEELIEDDLDDDDDDDLFDS